MKVVAFSVTLVLLTGLAWAVEVDEQACDKHIKDVCKAPAVDHKGVLGAKQCSAGVGDDFKLGSEGAIGFQERAQNLIQHHFEASMQYLDIANYFSEWNQNRKGFHSYFMKMSDDTWDNGVQILQHVVLRGGSLRGFFAFKQNDQTKLTGDIVVPRCEIEALSMALDIEKKLIEKAFDLLKNKGNHEHPDPEFTHFLSEKVSDHHIIRVKHLANHVNTLSRALDSTMNTGLVLQIYDTQMLK